LTTASENRHLFVVRVWHEPGGDGGQWRGSVEHAATGQRLYFATLDQLADFIALRLPSEGGLARRRDADAEPQTE
jgi:hypothetical protein